MATVTLSGQSFSCTRAVKGTDSITLYEGDSPYLCVAGISDFSDVTIEGGEWETPEPTLQEQTDALILDHEERLIYLELGVNE